MKKTVVLYSGGLDSTVVLAQAVRNGEDVLALSIDYGQTNGAELDVCKQLASFWGFPHRIAALSLDRQDPRHEIPARNTLFIAKALEQALLVQATHIAYGAEPEDVYVDSSLEFVRAMGQVTALHGVTLEAPLKSLKDRVSVMRSALDLGVPLDLVHSSRTNQIDGNCKTSQNFLATLHKFFPQVKPDVFLTALKNFHGGEPLYPGGSFGFIPLLSYEEEMWGHKQSLSRHRRPQYCQTQIKPHKGEEQAAKELGYKTC